MFDLLRKCSLINRKSIEAGLRTVKIFTILPNMDGSTIVTTHFNITGAPPKVNEARTSTGAAYKEKHF